MAGLRLLGLKEPQNLTGQVILDKNEDRGAFWGSYSCVYLGRYRNELVAVKIIQRTGKAESMKRKVDRERVVWATVNHPNILPFYGFADDERFAPFGALVSPWCAKGDASRYLSDHGETMPLNDRIDLWQGVIQGVVYLHGHEPRIVHGDLKPGNVLIDDSGAPRICDFGLAQIFLEEGHSDMTTTSEHTGTARYLAPELVSSDKNVYPTTASDVYALGCLGLEFMYLQKPFSNRANNLRGQIYMDLRGGIPLVAEKPRGSWPLGQAWSLMSQMWSKNPLFRPSAFIAGRTLDCAPFTLPLTVLQRIAFSVGIAFQSNSRPVDELKWIERCDHLRTLCLVSRACMECALPLLYGTIRLYPRQYESSLSMLTNTLYRTKGGSFGGAFKGYGGHTKALTFVIDFDLSRRASSTDIRDLLKNLPALRCIVITTATKLPVVTTIHSVPTLQVKGNHVLRLLGEECTLEALPVVQQLSLTGVELLSSVNFQPRELSSILLLPNLRTIDINRGSPRFHDWMALGRMLDWTMPRLTCLHIEWLRKNSVANENIFEFLRTHGHTIQHLILVVDLPGTSSPFSEVLPLCPNLLSINFSQSYDHFGLQIGDHPEMETPHHQKLERILIDAGRIAPTAELQFVLQIGELRKHSVTALPKLGTAEFKWRTLGTAEFKWHTSKYMRHTSGASFKSGMNQILLSGYPEDSPIFSQIGPEFRPEPIAKRASWFFSPDRSK